MNVRGQASAGTPTLESVLGTLTTGRLLDLCKLFGCEVRESTSSRDRLVRTLTAHLGDRLPAVLRELGRDELRAVCRRHRLDGSARARVDIQSVVLSAAGIDPRAITQRPAVVLSPEELPEKGQVVHARHRQWVVDSVEKGLEDESPLVRLVCLDDDDPGRQLDVLWNLELGARVVAPETHGLGTPAALDPPSHFGAYLHALKWSAVSAADATLFQAPFRAGIKLMAHQLTPLMKALELPRANLFIADDVGLGKTIEAGLVLQELLLRQQVSFVLVVCPASVCLQWQGEMQRRFGLRFEVMTRQFVAYRRQERGFGSNPWSTHNRFIVSHSLLRRPEYRDPLLHHLGDRARKGLLILDEAHVAAPASASRYATDTDTTRTIRDLAPRFDNRLFLSATPHNGHSNSFSALLEILDPVRFTRGVPVAGKKDLDAVMVRRLKRDLRQLGVEKFPRRLLVQFALRNENGTWSAAATTYDAETGKAETPVTTELGRGEPVELTLSAKLQRYTALCAPKSGQGRLPFISLQQRLLSSPEAFACTLEAHARGLQKKGGPVAAAVQRKLPLESADVTADAETYGVSDDTLAGESDAEVEKASESLPSPTEEARALLADMRALAERARRSPDAKVLALFAWMRVHLCPAIALGEDTRARKKWTDRRVIIFTEYADTKRYLTELLNAAISFTDDAEQRIRPFHGGMGDDARADVQRAFNAAPDKEPVRILVATDAAREGVNLQGHCSDLFHFDLPWNPARIEQRNGRIDRTLQEAENVHCHYFVYPDRVEDQVLDTIVRKVETVQRELGSLGAVLLEQVDKLLGDGITSATKAAVEKVGKDAKTATVDQELEASRNDLEAVRAEVERAAKRLESSKRLLEVNAESLRGVVEIGLRMAGVAELEASAMTKDGRPTFTLPKFHDRSWDVTLDTLRPPRTREETFWEWRQRAPKPVTFHALTSLSEDAEQLHLAHPLVKRILDRFLAQGFGAHDLTRVTALVAPDENVVRVVAYGRLTLFGTGAARLHDQLVPIAAAWSGDASAITPYKDRATTVTTIANAERLLASSAKAPNAIISARIRSNADALFKALWPHLDAEADAIDIDARRGLAERARRESEELRSLLARQRTAIDKAQTHLRQSELFDIVDKEQKRQVDLDLRHLDRRRTEVATEIETEPAAIQALYEVRMSRRTPIGLVVLWPESMT